MSQPRLLGNDSPQQLSVGPTFTIAGALDVLPILEMNGVASGEIESREGTHPTRCGSSHEPGATDDFDRHRIEFPQMQNQF
jgi:hypothetical protein